MPLLDKLIIRSYLNAPEASVLSIWCTENDYLGMYPEEDEPDYFLAAALWYAKKHYPHADNMDVCSFAGLLSSLCSGVYGGFGTELYPKEREIEEGVHRIAGGEPVADSIVVMMPAEVLRSPSEVVTHHAWRYMVQKYFEEEAEE